MLPSIINFWCNLWGNAWCCFQYNSAPTDCSVKPAQTVSAPHGLIISEAKKRSSKQTARSFRCTSFRFIRSQTVCIYWKARRKRSKRALWKQSEKQCKHRQASRSRNGWQKNGAKQFAAPSALCPACFRKEGKSLAGWRCLYAASFSGSPRIFGKWRIGRVLVAT